MSSLNQGRNEIPVLNSNAKCLLENWVEERAVGEIDPCERSEEVAIIGAKKFKDGHKGLLSIETDAKPETLTTTKDAYRPPVHANVRQSGIKQEMLTKMLYEQVSKEMAEEKDAKPETGPVESVYQYNYNNEAFRPTQPAPTAAHDYVNEQPVTFWTEHRDKIHGKTQEKTKETVFRKNAAFSTPIEEHWNQPKPYEMEMIPKM